MLAGDEETFRIMTFSPSALSEFGDVCRLNVSVNVFCAGTPVVKQQTPPRSGEARASFIDIFAS